MRPVIILLAVTAIVLSGVCLRQNQVNRDQLAAAQEQIQSASNALQSVQTELTVFKAQQATLAVQQALVVTQLVEQVAGLEAAKATAEAEHKQAQAQAEALKQQLADAVKTAQEQKDKLATLENEKEHLSTESTSNASQLQAVKRQLADLEKKAAAAAQLCADHEQHTRLELASWQSRWNDLTELKAQMRVVKQQLREERIATIKRQEAEESAIGNHGSLLRDGQWFSTTPANSHP